MISASKVRSLTPMSGCVPQLNLMVRPIMNIYYVMSTTSYESAMAPRGL